MSDKLDARVTMVWPKDLKGQVQEVAGPRGLTDFVLAAVQQHLKVAPSFDAVILELNQTKTVVQTLADKLVLGGDPQDRLQSLLEVEFPDWVETTGWPTAYADLVKRRQAPTPETPAPAPAERQSATAQPQEGVVYVDEAKIVRVGSQQRRAGRPEVQPLAPEVEVPTETPVSLDVPVEVPTEAVTKPGVRSDLLAKVMQATGQDLPTPLRFASEIPKPDAKDPKHNHSWERTDGVLCCDCGSWIDDIDPEYPNGIVRDEGWTPEVPEPAVELGPAMCPNNCGEMLIDSQCWTCG